jgi:hypothetical protein
MLPLASAIDAVPGSKVAVEPETGFVRRTGWRNLGCIWRSDRACCLREKGSRGHREKKHRPNRKTQAISRWPSCHFGCPGFAKDFRTVTSLRGFSA